MFIERELEKILLAPAERNGKPDSCTIAGNIALRWSAGCAFTSGAINIWLHWSQEHYSVVAMRCYVICGCFPS